MKPIKLFRFSFRNINSTSTREVLLLSREGCWAEASPLPNWSREKISGSARQLLSLTIPSQPYPSVAFGLSCLTHASHAPFSLPLAALFSGTPDEMIAQGERALDQGYTYAKIKVGHLTLVEAKHVVCSLLPYFILRVDVNRQWETEEALSFFSRFPKEAFEFVEEPLRTPEELPLFTHPFALDETLREHPGILKVPLPMFRALVIKPTLTGSIQTCKGWADLAKKKRVSVVISSSYESGVGTYHLACLARQIQSPKRAVGLDPYRTILDDVLTEKLQIKGGRLYIPKQICVNVTKIREITDAAHPMSPC